MCFLIFHNEKHLCREGIKTRTSKSKKIDIFPKGEVHGFGGKLAIFPTFYFCIISEENVFYDILEQNNMFLGYQNKMFKKAKDWHFSKAVSPWFWSKIGHFPHFLF